MVAIQGPWKLSNEDWRASCSHWAPDDYAVTFWRMAHSHVFRKYSTTNSLDVVDHMLGIANVSVIEFSREFPDWCAAHDTAPSLRLFWSMLKQRIDWDVVTDRNREPSPPRSIEAIEEAADDHGLDDDWVRTQMSKYRPPSLLHWAIADFILILSTRDRLLLDMHVFEGLSFDAMASILEEPKHIIITRIRAIGRRILSYATKQVITEWIPLKKLTPPGPYEIPDSVHQWVQRHYAATPYEWMGWAARSYLADVTYIIDIIDMAQGNYHTHAVLARPDERKNGHRAKLTAEQVREVMERLARHEPQQLLADDYGVSKGTISNIKRGKFYKHVANAEVA